MTMLWLALHLPLLSLEAFGTTLPAGQRDRPLALVAEHRIVAANASALRAGIQPGLKRATALALVADALLGQADAARDAAALQAVAHTALAFTPSVTLDGTHTVLLEVQASLRYFGGLPALLKRLHEALAPLGHRVQVASAPTALGAALLARWRDGLAEGPHSSQLSALMTLLDGAPLALLGPGHEHQEALQGMGLHTLADLRELPRAGLARRFGAALLDDIDRALGRQPDPRTWLTLPDSFDSRLELFARADTTEQVLAGAAMLLARLVAWALAQQARVAAFTLYMHHETRHRGDHVAVTELHIALAEPALDIGHLQLLLRERLAHCQLLAPTLELQIHCRHLVRSPAPNGELFPSRQSEAEGLGRLLERLRARLGDAQVQALQPLADHRPERACGAVPLASRAAASRAAVPAAAPGTHGGLPLGRPVWLLPDPLPLAERRSLPLLDGRPLQLLSGPERIETGWWDGAVAARDYFIAQAADGALVWLYRARLPVTEATSAQAGWFLQGRFG